MDIDRNAITKIAARFGPEAWCDDPEVETALDLIAEIDLVDAVQIRSLFDGPDGWLDELAIALAVRHLRRVDSPVIGQPEEVTSLDSPHPALDMGAWEKVGVREPAVAHELSLGLGLDRATGLHRLGLSSTDLRQVNARAPAFDGIERFLKAGHSFHLLYAFVDEGVALETAVRWVASGVANTAKARSWLEAGFDIEEATDWSSAGFLSPGRARSWRNGGFNPSEASAWYDAGATGASAAAAWRSAGCRDPKGMKSWRAAGAASPDVARVWHEAGISAASAQRWIKLGATPTVASGLVSNSVTIDVAERWCHETRRPLPELRRWLSHVSAPIEAVRWWVAGIESPSMLSGLRVGAKADDLSELRAKGFTTEESLVLLSSVVTSADADRLGRAIGPADITQLRRTGIAPQLWARWMSACRDAGTVAAWHGGHVSIEELEDLIANHRLKPWKLKEWAGYEFGVTDVAEAHRHGYVAAHAWETAIRGSGLSTDDFATWLGDGSKWFEESDTDPDAFHELLRMLHEEGMEWSPISEDLFGLALSDEWLDEVMDRAMHLVEDLAKEPRWPRVFESEEVTIALASKGDWALAWVGVGKRGGLVCFDVIDFDVYTTQRNPSWRYAAGVAIAWFLDCCLVLRSNRRDHPYRKRSLGSGKAQGLARAHGRYVPQLSFTRHYTEVVEGRRISPKPHWVDGHIRRLSPGWKPSDQARGRAPAWARRQLRSDARKTWVSGFHKGSNAQYEELRVYLSKYSALADAMALADLSVDDD